MKKSSNIDPAKKRTIIMVGCFDTKGEDFAHLHSCLQRQHVEIISVNTGVLGTTALFPVTIAAERVAEAAGSDLSTLRKNNDRGQAIEKMGEGAGIMVAQLSSERPVHGIIGMGGGGGTFMALAAMRALPFGVPKLCVSTLATKDLSSHIGNKDILLMPSIVDVNGLNSISRVLISQAAAAIAGMMNTPVLEEINTKGRIAISVFGNTTTCVDRCTEILKAEGYDVLSFHSVGVGGKTMEALIMDGFFDAILDITTTELADDLCGGICSAGPDRLTAGGLMGIPQVVAPGCLDMVNFGAMDTVPEKYGDRKLYSWSPDVTLMRTNVEENKILGENMAKKINASTGAVTVLLPLGGLSKIGAEGEVFHDPKIDQVLFDTIRKNIKSSVKVLEVDSNIDTASFADEAVKVLLELVNEQTNSNSKKK